MSVTGVEAPAPRRVGGASGLDDGAQDVGVVLLGEDVAHLLHPLGADGEVRHDLIEVREEQVGDQCVVRGQDDFVVLDLAADEFSAGDVVASRCTADARKAQRLAAVQVEHAVAFAHDGVALVSGLDFATGEVEIQVFVTCCSGRLKAGDGRDRVSHLAPWLIERVCVPVDQSEAVWREVVRA